MTIAPFAMIERAVKEMVEARHPAAAGKVGGDLSYSGTGLYVWLGLIPGAGFANQTSGEWSLDLDVFETSYAAAMEAALAIEAALLPGRFQGTQMNIDIVTGGGPAEVPWEDEGVYRVSAVYTFSARRSG